MTVQRFDPREHAEPAVRSGWLHPGERLYWTRHSFNAAFEVPGRARSGKILKQSGWRTAGRRAMAVADGALAVVDFFATDISSGPSAPSVRIFGTQVDCFAAKPGPHSQRAFWILTDRRFGYLRADDDGRLITEWELPAGRFGYSEFKKKGAVYERFGFADGSGIDFQRPRGK